jgi:hypothetical protein
VDPYALHITETIVEERIQESRQALTWSEIRESANGANGWTLGNSESRIGVPETDPNPGDNQAGHRWPDRNLRVSSEESKQ